MGGEVSFEGAGGVSRCLSFGDLWASPGIVKASLKLRPVGLQRVSRIGSATSMPLSCVCVRVLYKSWHHATTTRRAWALVVKWCRDRTSCSRVEKNASAAALSAADRTDRGLDPGLRESLAEPDRRVL
jgi:hypothetical protein